jgi:hypothetical protein
MPALKQAMLVARDTRDRDRAAEPAHRTGPGAAAVMRGYATVPGVWHKASLTTLLEATHPAGSFHFERAWLLSGSPIVMSVNRVREA